MEVNRTSLQIMYYTFRFNLLFQHVWGVNIFNYLNCLGNSEIFIICTTNVKEYHAILIKFQKIKIGVN